MSLTRKMLKAFGIDDGVADQIIDAHVETLESYKAELNTLKGNTEKLHDLQALYDAQKSALDEAQGYKSKYEDVAGEYAAFREASAAQKALEVKESAFRRVLAEAGIKDKYHDAIVRVSDISGISVGDDGNVSGSEELKSRVLTEWADFIPSTETVGASVAQPPANNGGSTFSAMTLADKMAYANEHPHDAEVASWLAN